jgi:Cep192 domain 4
MSNLHTALLVCAVLTAGASAQSAQTESGHALRVSPSALMFGPQSISSEGDPATVTLKNPTQRTIRLNQVIASGIDFQLRNKCGSELGPGAECKLVIVFKPAIAGERFGILEIFSSDSVSPQFIPMQGTGTD